MAGGEGLAGLEEFFELFGVGGGEGLAEGVFEGGFGFWLGCVGLLGELGFSLEKGVVGVGEAGVVCLEMGRLEFG